MERMPNWLRNRAFLTPERIAIQTKKEKITFLELHTKVEKIARQLAYYDVKKGDVIALYLKNSVEMISVIHALTYVGAVTLLVNTRLSKEEISWQLKDAGASLLISDVYTEQVEVRELPLCELLASKEEEMEIQEEFVMSDLHSIMYTSGTTGNPKGVMLTYGNHYHSAMGSVLNLGLHHEDCWLACMPFFHVGGLSLLLKNVIYGMKIYVQEKFQAEEIHGLLMDGKITIVSLVSKMLVDILKLDNQEYPSTLRCVLLGGGPVPESLLEESLKRNVPIYQTYGMTETASQIVTLSPEDIERKSGSVGKPLFQCQVQIKDALSFEEGEILVKGPNVTKGYSNCEGATDEVVKDGWFYTGDIGYLDDEGFLYVLDRRKDLIISGGENVYPAQIESVLLSHEAIEDAGVIGIEDEEWGQVPVAFIKGNDVTEEEVLHYCHEKLARYKVPKKIYFIEELPRNASQKLLRRQLREML